MKLNVKYLVVLLICLGILVLIEISRPRPIDWSHGFSSVQKKPYGSYIVYQIFDSLFADQKIETSELPIYNTLNNLESDSSVNYIFLNDVFEIDEFERDKLLSFIASGNSAFIGANNFVGGFADSLKIDCNFGITFSDTVSINFVNPNLKRQNDFYLKPNEPVFYFKKFDTLNTTILGTNKYDQVNFIKMKFGKGLIYLSTVPIAFTNYYLLYQDFAEYVAGAFSYLKGNIVVWDEYYKINKRKIKTPIRFILSNESLSWSYYLLIAFFILFIIFKGKRTQRIIPVVTPLKNTTLEFVSIIGKLYYQTKDHKGICRKRIIYLMDFIRSRYFLDTTETNLQFLKKLSGKSGVPKDILRKLFDTINFIKNKKAVSEKEFISLNNQIDQFYKQVDA